MNTSAHLYISACSHLYGVLLDEFFLYSPEDVSEADRATNATLDTPAFAELAQWAMTESTDLAAEGGYDLNLDEMVRGFALSWLPGLWDVAREIKLACTSVECGRSASCLYCRTVLYVLDRFVEIMESPAIKASPYYARYAAMAADIRQRRAEVLVKTWHAVEGPDMVDVQQKLDSAARDFAAQWVDAVMAVEGQALNVHIA